MQFSTRIISFFIVLVALAAFVFALPAQRASTADIRTILETMQAKIQPTLGEIKTTVSHRTVSSETLRPLLQGLREEFSSAAGSLDQLGWTSPVFAGRGPPRTTSAPCSVRSSRKSSLHSKGCSPAVNGLLPGIDGGLSQVLSSAGGLLGGVLGLVQSLLVNVVGLLGGLDTHPSW